MLLCFFLSKIYVFYNYSQKRRWERSFKWCFMNGLTYLCTKLLYKRRNPNVRLRSFDLVNLLNYCRTITAIIILMVIVMSRVI